VRPTTGFSVEDAMNARRVIIVGGDAGVSGADEQRLRASGCEVIRLAGKDEAETKQMLMALLEERIRPGPPPVERAAAEAPTWVEVDIWAPPPDYEWPEELL